MPRLHLFFPENDLALALDKEYYTPPPAASRLRLSGATLPLWFGNDGDEFVAEGVNARWLSDMRLRFAIQIRPFAQWHTDFTPSPWGWSKASRRAFILRGVPQDILPNDSALASMRQLSHRSTAAEINRMLAAALAFPVAPAAEQINSAAEAEAFLSRHPQAVFKLPWSSSGRGLIVVNHEELPGRLQAIEGAIRRQGMLLAEPRMNKKLDFALLFTMQSGCCRYDGISVFNTVQFGSYAGNILAPQDDLFAMAAEACAPARLDDIVAALPAILEKTIGTAYDGPLGIDMMAVAEHGYTVAPAVELNLRMTMGHVCRRIYGRYVANGHHGSFSISNRPAAFDATVRNGRIYSGTLPLSQPGTAFTFVCQIS